jgi:3-oxoacyl-[acyl-carrier protein] reductase
MTDPRAVALVTGASSGIGRSAAVALAKAGFDVVINYSRNETGANETAALAQAAGATTLIYRCDVAEDAEVKAMLAATKDTFGRLDALINNAGITVDTPPKAMDDLDVEDWNRVFAVNVLGIFLVTRAAAPMLREAHGAVVNTNSVAGLRPAVQPLPYAASKAAVANLTKTLATALGPEIRVNGVAPGWMEGDWMEHALGDNYDGLMARRAKYTPLERNVTPDDIAETMLSLITSNRMVTGEIITVDGGFTSTT